MSLLIALAVWLALALAFYLILRGRHLSLHSMDELEKLTTPVDVDAFTRLMSADLSQFIASEMRGSDRQTARKMRNRAAMRYVSLMASNAALLIRATDIAKHSDDAAVREKALALQALAIKLRFFSLIVFWKLYIGQFVPLGADSDSLTREYCAFKDSVQFLFLAMQSKRPAAV